MKKEDLTKTKKRKRRREKKRRGTLNEETPSGSPPEVKVTGVKLTR